LGYRFSFLFILSQQFAISLFTGGMESKFGMFTLVHQSCTGIYPILALEILPEK